MGDCGAQNEPAAQTEGQAMDEFFAIEEQAKGLQHGKPIPGYAGTNRRIQADNLFGMTYAEARAAAAQS